MRPTNKRFEPERRSQASSESRRRTFTKGRFMVPPEQVEFEDYVDDVPGDGEPALAERASKWDLRTAHLPVGQAPTEHSGEAEDVAITVDLTAEQEETETYWQRHSAGLPKLSEVDD